MNSVRTSLMILICLAMASAMQASTVSHVYHFSKPQVEIRQGDTLVVLEGAPTSNHPHQYQLPQAPVILLLPPNEEATSLTVIQGEAISLGRGFTISKGHEAIPLTNAPDGVNTNSSREDDEATVVTQYFAGHGIAYATIDPVQYLPESGELLYYPNMEVRITSSISPQATAAYNSLLKTTPQVQERLDDLVQNPDQIPIYGPTLSRPIDHKDLLVIAPAALLPYYQEFIDSKNRRGIITLPVTLEDIYSQVPGNDNADKVRNCIIQYYQGSDISYVLLAGDGNLVPYRLLHGQGGMVEDTIPADIYYAGLDGNWNTDGDRYWGEPPWLSQPCEYDLLAEVYVGRSCADNRNEALHFVHKSLRYEKTPISGEVTTALMVGEDLYLGQFGEAFKEEIHWGSSNYGYTTVGFPPYYTVNTLYESPTWLFNLTDILQALNSGPTLINHMGHTTENFVMKVYLPDINDVNLTNNGLNHNYYIVYSQGCRAGRFSAEECAEEEFTTVANGAVAFIGNSSYGFYCEFGTNGVSQRFDREFFDAVFGEGITRLGKTNQDSKEDNIDYTIGDMYGYGLFCYYELNLLGDPTLDVWTAVPGTFDPGYPAHVPQGTTTMTVYNILPDGALVTVSHNNQPFEQALSVGGSAVLTFSPPLNQLGIYDLAITYHNMLPYEGTFEVVSNHDIGTEGENLQVAVNPTIPDKFDLHPGYPNPFNPQTSLRFDLPQAAQVDLVVYDLQGKPVAQLTQGLRQAGIHIVNFNGSGLASGIYLVSLSAGDFHQVQKVMLMK